MVWYKITYKWWYAIKPKQTNKQNISGESYGNENNIDEIPNDWNIWKKELQWIAEFTAATIRT